jgi:divalent metal cation (Fe/Co/Zn/Cd) transporter
VYASGDHNVVEADIIVDESLALRTSHNIGESAQYCLEQLDGIERAFVHLDITANAFSGKLESFHSKYWASAEAIDSFSACD